MKLYLLVPILLLCFIRVNAQDENQPSGSAQYLLDAQSLFAAGKLNQVSAKLDSCFKNNPTKDERVQAYKLLSVTYTYLEDYVKAENSVLNLLRLENEYKVNQDIDPTEFIKLYQKFRTYPIFHIGLRAGGNLPVLGFGKTYESDGAPKDAGTYKWQYGFSVGIDGEFQLRKVNEHLEVCPGILYSSRSFNVSQTLRLSPRILLGNGQSTIINSTLEKLTWIDIPVVMRYNFKIGKTEEVKTGLVKGIQSSQAVKPKPQPFVEAGISLNYLLKNDQTILKSNNSPKGQAKDIVNTSMMEFSKSFNYGVMAGGGFKLDIPMAILVVRLDFNFLLNRLSIRDENLSTLIRINDYRMHNIALTLGYIRKIYKPKKIFE